MVSLNDPDDPMHGEDFPGKDPGVGPVPDQNERVPGITFDPRAVFDFFRSLWRKN